MHDCSPKTTRLSGEVILPINRCALGTFAPSRARTPSGRSNAPVCDISCPFTVMSRSIALVSIGTPRVGVKINIRCSSRFVTGFASFSIAMDDPAKHRTDLTNGIASLLCFGIPANKARLDCALATAGTSKRAVASRTHSVLRRSKTRLASKGCGIQVNLIRWKESVGDDPTAPGLPWASGLSSSKFIVLPVFGA